MTSSLKAFKGTLSEYYSLHYWVGKQLGKPKKCENCGKKDIGLFHWANISQLYLKDIADWVRLCPMCHALFDNRDPRALARNGKWGAPLGNNNAGVSTKGGERFCKKSHPLSGNNLYLKKRGKYIVRICKTCQKSYEMKFKERMQ